MRVLSTATKINRFVETAMAFPMAREEMKMVTPVMVWYIDKGDCKEDGINNSHEDGDNYCSDDFSGKWKLPEFKMKTGTIVSMGNFMEMAKLFGTPKFIGDCFMWRRLLTGSHSIPNPATNLRRTQALQQKPFCSKWSGLDLSTTAWYNSQLFLPCTSRAVTSHNDRTKISISSQVQIFSIFRCYYWYQWTEYDL